MTTAESTGPGLAGSRLLADLVAALLDVTGEDDSWAAGITPATLLEGDLQLESMEFLVLGELLRSRYGDRVDLPAFLAGLEIDEIIGLTVGHVLAYVAMRRQVSGSGGDA